MRAVFNSETSAGSKSQPRASRTGCSVVSSILRIGVGFEAGLEAEAKAGAESATVAPGPAARR